MNKEIKLAPGIELTDERWINRKKSNLVKWFLLNSETSVETLCEGLGYTKAYFNNKITRDSFSFEDLVAIAYLCGFKFAISSWDENLKREIRYFDILDEEASDRVYKTMQNVNKCRHDEYIRKKKRA